MFKTIFHSLREFKKTTVITAIYLFLEVLLECIIPFIMAMLIDNMTGNSMTPIIKYGLILLIMAMASLLFGTLGGRTAATASTGLAKNLRHDMFHKLLLFFYLCLLP